MRLGLYDRLRRRRCTLSDVGSIAMNEILYGKDDTEGIVGLHPEDYGSSMRLFYSDGTSEVTDLWPYFFCTSEGISHAKQGYDLAFSRNLRGDLHYGHLAVFKDMEQMRSAKGHVIDNCDGDDPVYVNYDPIQQYLMQTGITTNVGLSMDDLHRLQLDIETYSVDGFPDPTRRPDEVIIVSLSDNRGWKALLHTADVDVKHGMALSSEKDLLKQLVKVIHRRDPDTIEGHNILGFDLPYLRQRFEMKRVPFRIGRDNEAPQWWESSKEFAEREVEYEKYIIAGRSVIDSYFLAADYDTYARDLPSYGLKPIAKHFGITADDREYVKGENIPQVWDENPKRLLKYALDDAIETREVVSALGNASFALTKIVPMTWQQAIIAGTASTLESIMAREYLRQRHSIPNGSDPESFGGGYTEIFERGVWDDLAYADVSSLYPSIMLSWDVSPETDQLGVFTPMLKRLTDLRLENKQKLSQLESGTQEYERVDAEQAAQKILINSAYGMLGFPYALWSDIDAAAFVTYKGREILKEMIIRLEEEGGRVVGADTDGALFVVPDGRTADDTIAPVDDAMPEGVEIDKDYETEKALTYKAKNYAKMKGGEIDISGASLMGRQKEPFLREYIHDQLENILREDVQAVHERHEKARRDVIEGRLGAEDLCRRQRLKKTMSEYKRGVKEVETKHRLGQYEVALRKWEITGIEPKKGDTVRYYVRHEPLTTNTKVSRDARLLREYGGDEDTEYYLDRLDTTADLFRPFFDRPEVVFDQSSDQHGLFGGPDYTKMQIRRTQVNETPNDSDI